jgi:hypothetical protein
MVTWLRRLGDGIILGILLTSGLVALGGLYGYLRGPYKASSDAQAPTIEGIPTPDCKIAQVVAGATSFGRRPKGGKHFPPVLVYVSYLARNGQSVKRPECPWKWVPPVFTITGDERGVLEIDPYPWVAQLLGPAGTAYTVQATDPISGLHGEVEIELAGDPSRERKPQVVQPR